MNITDKGYDWDVSYDPDLGEDLIMLDTTEGTIYLTRDDLVEFLEAM